MPVNYASVIIKPSLRDRIKKLIKNDNCPFPTVSSFVNYYIQPAIDAEEKKAKEKRQPLRDRFTKNTDKK